MLQNARQLRLSQKLADFNRLMLPSDDGELLLKSTGLAAKPEAPTRSYWQPIKHIKHNQL